MVDKNLIMIKIDKIKEYLGYLQAVRKHSLAEFRNDPQIFGSAERFLHLAIECAIDIGNHIISDLHLQKPGSNREIFEFSTKTSSLAMIFETACVKWHNSETF